TIIQSTIKQMNRDQRFLEALAEVRQLLVKKSIQDADAVRLAELEAMFRTRLPEAEEATISKIALAQHDLRLQQFRLAELYEDSLIEDEEYERSLREQVTWYARLCSRILGEDKFEQLFDLKVSDAGSIIEDHLFSLSSLKSCQETPKLTGQPVEPIDWPME